MVKSGRHGVSYVPFSLYLCWPNGQGEHLSVYMVTLMVSISTQRLTKYSPTKDFSDTDVVNVSNFFLFHLSWKHLSIQDHHQALCNESRGEIRDPARISPHTH